MDDFTLLKDMADRTPLPSAADLAPARARLMLAITQPAATHSAATQPPATQPPATHPAITHPAITQPPATHSAATQPPAIHPPATRPPRRGAETHHRELHRLVGAQDVNRRKTSSSEGRHNAMSSTTTPYRASSCTTVVIGNGRPSTGTLTCPR